MEEEKITVAFDIRKSTRDRVNELYNEYNEKQIEITGKKVSKNQFIDDLLTNYYYQSKGSEMNDPIMDERITMLIEDAIKSRLEKVMKNIYLLNQETQRTTKMAEILLRITAGTREEQINKRMRVHNITEEEAEESLDYYIENELFSPCPVVEAIDRKIAEEFDE